MSSLIPSRQIAFSAELAATLGLEEAVLLQCLSDQSQDAEGETNGRYQWFYLNASQLKSKLPFWQDKDIQRIVENLRQQGVILISSAPLSESKELRYAFNECAADVQKPTQPSPSQAAAVTGEQHADSVRANPIATSWKPDDTCIRLLAQQGVPAHFAHEQTAEFVHYWSERGEARHSWGNRFVTHVLRKWREFETRQQATKPARIDSTAWDTPPWENSRGNEAHSITKQWRPSTDAMEILEIQAGIHRNFVDDSIPEFILYWSEKGDRCNTWNARFISHVKRQWAEFQHTLKNESRPSVMTADWEPSNDVYDVLKFARIEVEFAQNLVPEFVMYWRDRNEMRPSWNTLFLQFAKLQWQRRNQTDNSLRERSLAEDLSDRSWAN